MKPSPAKVAFLHVAGENEPTKPNLWAKVQALAKGEQKSIKVDGKTIDGPNDGKGFTVFPSAYANGWASKTYGDLGGGWKKKARGKAKKDVGHGGLDEWFSGHGGSKGKGEDATWGDWVSISPVTKTLDSGKKVEKGDIVGPCGISDDPDWKDLTKGGEDPLKCMPRQKAHDMPKKERAEKAKAKQKAEKADSSRGKKPTNTPTFKKDKSASIIAARYAAKKYEGIDFKPPKGVAAEAEKGLEYRRKSGKGGLSSQDAGKEGIGSGVQRAVNLKNRNNIAPDTIQQMLNFFSRHKKNKAISAENRDTPWEDAGYVAWLLWGGDAGLAWAKKVKKQMEAADAKKAALSDAARCAPGGQCFRYTTRWGVDGPGNSRDDLVVHGNVRGLSGPHAWVERKDGRVFDWQTAEGVWETLGRQPDPSYSQKGWPQREFYAEFKPTKMRKYREEDAMINGIRAGHHGPWTEAEEHHAPISKKAYQGHHTPSDDGAAAHDLGSGSHVPADILTNPEWYTGYRSYLREFWNEMLKAQGKPGARITIYRALPQEYNTFSKGDWVTPSYKYAKDHAEETGWHIIQAQVPAHTLIFAGDDLMEWGYWGPTVKAR